MIAATVYVLAALVALLCAVLLFLAWRRTKVRLLFWSALCFVGLTLNNVLLVVDLLVVPDVDLFLWRNLAAAIGIGLLLYGLIWTME